MLSRLKKVKRKYNELSNTKILSLALIISIVLAIVSEINNPNGSYIGDIKGMILNFLPIIFFNIAPILYIFRKKFLKKIRESPEYAVGMILYYLIFMPLFVGIKEVEGVAIIDRSGIFYFLVTALNYTAVLLGHIILIKYVFLDIVFKRRKPTGKDTIIVFMTYVSMGVTFGLVYALITLLSEGNAFTNMDLEMAKDLGTLKLYMRHIYYSFITLTSVGYGDISPVTWIAQLVTVIESILGVFLLSFSLGIILSSETEEYSIKQKENDKFREDLLHDLEKLTDLKEQNQTLKKELLIDIEKIIDEKLNSNKKEEG